MDIPKRKRILEAPNYTIFYSLLSTLAFLLILICNIFMRNSINDPTDIIVTHTFLFGTAVCAILIISYMFGRSYDDISTRSFLRLLMVLSVAMCAYTVQAVTSGYEASKTVTKIAYTMYVLCGELSLMLYWFYIDSIDKSLHKRWVNKCVMIIGTLPIIALIINYISPFYFYINYAGYINFCNNALTPYRTVLLLIVPVLHAIFCFLRIIKYKINRTRKIVLILYLAVPIAAYLIQEKLPIVFNLLYLCGVLSLLTIYMNIAIARNRELYRQREINTKQNMQMMLSQIGPHFIFNALSSIGALCDTNPATAKDAIDKFALYLRGNMESLNQFEPIPFEKELEHIKAYLWIEKLRFPDTLKVEYQIKATNFSVPVLSLQPLVENAVRHGIFEAGEGTVTISATQDKHSYIVTIKDTGIGFNASKIADRNDSKTHIGIANSSERIKNMMGGTLNIESALGVGTTVTIKLPKDK